MSKPSHDVNSYDNTTSYRFRPILYPRDRLNHNFVYSNMMRPYDPKWWYSRAHSAPDDLLYLLNRTVINFTVAQA
jgi:hypothetical protein